MIFRRLVAAACAVLGFAALPQVAQAQTDSFRIEANSTEITDLTICNPEVRVVLSGDGDTDLDYVIRNSRGEIVHSDYSISDQSEAVLYRRGDVQCEEFELRTTNLGGVWNLLDITLADVRTDSGNPVSTDSYRVDANSTHVVDMSICSPQVRIHINGDDDTDLDYVIRNSRGEIVHSDYGLSDETETVLYRRSGVECESFELTTTNLGAVYNLYLVQLEDVVQDRAPVRAVGGSGDGNNRDISIQNRTGQTIMYLYWSNVAASNWGEDRLGSGVLANMQDWNVTVDDGSGACRFDFMARLADGRELEQRNINVCEVYVVQFATVGGGAAGK